MVTRWRDASLRVIWDGSKRLRGGYLNCKAELRKPRPPVPHDASELPAVPRRGRPPRAGEKATHRIELRLTLPELRTLQRLATSNNRPLAVEIRESMLDLASDGAVPDVLHGSDLVNYSR